MKYFTVEELTRSTTASQRGIDNSPNSIQATNLSLLVEKVLDPLREAYGAPITVNSGFRSPELNKAVKGANNSQHTKGEAADITVGSKTGNMKLFNLIRDLRLPFDQLIDEKAFSWIHVSYRHGNNRGQILHLK